MGDGLRKGAVVGHQQQALAVLIQTAHRVQAGGNVAHQLHDRLAAQLVAGGGHIAAGLIQGQIVQLLVLFDIDALVIHMQHIAVGVHFVAHLHGVAVDLHAALGNDLLGCAAGAQTLLRHDLLNTFFCHNQNSLCASRRSKRALLPCFEAQVRLYQKLRVGSPQLRLGFTALPEQQVLLSSRPS